MNEEQKKLQREHFIIEDIASTNMINNFFDNEEFKKKINIRISNIDNKSDEESLSKLRVLNGAIDRLTKDNDAHRDKYRLLIESHRNLEFEQA